jgi:hypothetical protein
MMREVKEKIEANKGLNGTVGIRLEVPALINRKAKQHRIHLIGRRKKDVTLADAMIDLLEKATRTIKPIEE